MNRKHRDNEPSTSHSLLHSARRGDSDGLRKLAQVYGPIIYAWARRCGCQPADAADIMQETLTSMTTAVSQFDHDQPDATFRGWLWTVTRNKLRDRVRRNQDPAAAGGTDANMRLQQVPDRAVEHTDWIDENEPPSQLQSDLASARLRALQLLHDSIDPRSWEMFWESAIVGRDPADVAKDLGVSRWAVYKARARVLQRLKQQMLGME